MPTRCVVPGCSKEFPDETGLGKHYKTAKTCSAKWKALMRRQVQGIKRAEPEPFHEEFTVAGDLIQLNPRMDAFVEGQSSGLPRACDLQSPSPQYMDQDDPMEHLFSDTTVHEEFPAEYEAGRTFGRCKTRWERMQDDCVNGLHDRWGGFGNQDEWELAIWMMKSGLSQGEIDKYLKLNIVSGPMSPVGTNGLLISNRPGTAPDQTSIINGHFSS